MERKPPDDSTSQGLAGKTTDHLPSAATVPQKIGRFEVLGLLGQGAFGKVYKARDPRLDREVAIKVPARTGPAAPEEVDRFLREARAVAALHHPNLCAVHEVGKAGDSFYIVMAFVPGQSLAEHLKERKGPIDARQAALVVRKLALGLAAAHAKGIIHRDLKPANIMLDRDRRDVVIMDFGLARYPQQGEARRTQEGVLMGTPAYMSPEQARGEARTVGPASDLYSLGAILYELLAGRPPFRGSLTEVLGQVLHVEPEPPSRVRPGTDRRLEAICLQALAKAPEDRYASMKDLADALDDYLKGAMDNAPPPPPPQGKEEKEEGLSRVVRALAAEYRQEASAAVDEAVRRARLPLWKLLTAAGALLALTAVGLVLFLPRPAPPTTRAVFVQVDVNLNDPTLVFLLDGTVIPAQALQAPLDLPLGEHELVVLRDAEPIQVHHFEVNGDTGPEIALKQGPRPPGEDEPDFPPGLAANAAPRPALPPPPPTVKDLRRQQRRKGEWLQLFNGKDLSGWKMRPKTPGNWRVVNGVLTCDGGRYGHLFTEENDWTDVHIRIVAKFSDGASGVCLRAPFILRPTAKSYQVSITNARPTGTFTIGGKVASGNLTKEKPVAPGEWFTMEVIARGNHFVTRVNGKVIADHIDARKTYTKGHLALRHPGDKTTVEFKSVEVRDLSPPKAGGEEKPFTIHKVPLSDTLAGANLQVARVPGGGFKLGWNDRQGRAHVTSLGDDLQPLGPDIVLPHVELRGLAVNDDKTVLALVFEAPCQMQARGLGAEGRELFKTVLSGADGKGPGTKFATAWFKKAKATTTGPGFAVHFGHFWHTKGHGTHQGGYYAELDRQGGIVKQNRWTVSHSIDQALLYHTGDILTVSVGDAFPRGLPFINRTHKARRLIYPPAESKDGYRPKRTPLGAMVPVGDQVGLAFATTIGEVWQYLYVLTDKAGEVKQFVRLREGLKIQHAGVSLAPWGPHLLLVWKETDTRTGFAPIDASGRFLKEPTFVEEPFARRNDLPVFANGDVGWLTATAGAKEVKVVRVKR